MQLVRIREKEIAHGRVNKVVLQSRKGEPKTGGLNGDEAWKSG